jgi:aerobic C4-dicarboxylate transporter
VLKGEIPFDESTMGGELHGDQYVDNAVSQKSPTKQMSVVAEPKIKNTVTLPEDQ